MNTKQLTKYFEYKTVITHTSVKPEVLLINNIVTELFWEGSLLGAQTLYISELFLSNVQGLDKAKLLIHRTENWSHKPSRDPRVIWMLALAKQDFRALPGGSDREQV